MLDRLAVLIEVGERLPAAVEAVASAGSGPIVAELDTVGGDLQAGSTPPEALDAWARRAHCPVIGVLATEIRRGTTSDDLVAALRHHAAEQHDIAHRRRVELLRARVATVWLIAAVSVVVSVLPMVG